MLDELENLLILIRIARDSLQLVDEELRLVSLNEAVDVRYRFVDMVLLEGTSVVESTS